MRKKILIILLMMLMLVVSLAGCVAVNDKPDRDRYEDSYKDPDNDSDEDDVEDESEEQNRDASIVISNDRISCTVEYDSEMITYGINPNYEYMAPIASASHDTYGVGQVYFGIDLSVDEPPTIEDVYQEHSDFLYEYRMDVEVSAMSEYVSDAGYKYAYFTSSSTWYGTGYESTYICVQLTDDNMMAIVFDEVIELDSLAEFVETNFYIREAEVLESDIQEAEGYIAVEWDGADTDSGQGYDLCVLLQGATADGASITCDTNGENYYDSYGNLVASIEKVQGRIIIVFYDTDVYYRITVENSFPTNGWSDSTIITCDLPGATGFDQWDYYYRGETGMWYFTFGVENGILTSIY